MKVVSLGEIATIDRKAVKPEDIVNGTTYVGLENIVSGGDFASVGSVANGELASGKFAFDERHILYGKLRPYLAKIAVPSFSGVCSTDILPIRVGSAANKMFVAHFLRQTHIVDQVNGLAAGANLPRISPSSLLSIQLPLPALDEQRRIAAILDKVDELRTKRREALAHLDTLTQSIFHSMFGDPLPRNTSYLVERLGDVCLKITDGTHHSPSIAASGVPYITAKHLRPAGLDFFGNPWFIAPKDHEEIYRRCDPKKGDVLYIKDGATTGLAAVNNYDFEFSMLSSLALLRPGTRLTATYLVAWLNSPSVKADLIRGVAGAAITRFTLSKIKEFRLPVPPLEFQQAFATRIAAVERLKELHRRHLAETDALFASLQHRAFRGEI